MTTTPVADETAVDHRDPEIRLRSLFDQGTLRLLNPRDDSGALTARGDSWPRPSNCPIRSVVVRVLVGTRGRSMSESRKESR